MDQELKNEQENGQNLKVVVTEKNFQNCYEKTTFQERDSFRARLAFEMKGIETPPTTTKKDSDIEP